MHATATLGEASSAPTLRLRSLRRLDVPRAWRTVRQGARLCFDIPDRLPFEVVDRISPEGPALIADHNVEPLHVVLVRKKRGSTTRPIVRMSPADTTLYQALVDRLVASAHERPYAEPWTGLRRYLGSTREAFARGAYDYLLTVDVSNFLLSLDLDVVERRLAAARADRRVTADLLDLLRAFELQGARGLPQGVPASTSLANLYLSSLDAFLSERGYEFRRHVDEISVCCRRFSDARAAQELIEQRLYRDGLALAADKSKIVGRRAVAREIDAAAAAAEHWQQELQAELALDRPAQGRDTVRSLAPEAAEASTRHAELLEEIRTRPYRDGTRRALRDGYRALAATGSTAGLADVPDVLVRFPDLVRPAMRYVAAMARANAPSAFEAFRTVLASSTFWREEELLELCQAALRMPPETSGSLAARFASLASEHPSALVRARAVLAWGALSEPGDFSVADDFWRSTPGSWSIYPIVAIQAKVAAGRNRRYAGWRAASLGVAALAEAIARRPFAWSAV
jgi:Reverse transcriptase (RNA-dependent DNA polymerase)